MVAQVLGEAGDTSVERPAETGGGRPAGGGSGKAVPSRLPLPVPVPVAGAVHVFAGDGDGGSAAGGGWGERVATEGGVHGWLVQGALLVLCV